LRFGTALPKKAFSDSKSTSAASQATSPNLKKIALRAAKIAPAIAVAGALVAVTQAHGSPFPAPGAAANRAANRTAEVHADRHARLAGHDSAAHGESMAAFESMLTKVVARETARQAQEKARHAIAARKAAARRAALDAVHCKASASGMLPDNFGAIVGFLTTHGYTKMAAAGIAGNMYQESKGDPESAGSGGGGLIGFTPLPAGYVTGNVAADLHTQLEAVLAYNQQWAAYIPALNAAATPTQAADVYMNDFERPGIPAAYNREGAASAVAAACGF
jgi:Phage tail lysozyme